MKPLGLLYAQIILSRWRTIVGLIVGCTFGAWLYSVAVLANNPVYESAARLNIVPTNEELGYANRFVRGSTFDGGGVLVQTYAEFAHTRPVVEPIVDRFIADRAAAAGITPTAWIARESQPDPLSVGTLIAELNYGTAPQVPLREQLVQEVMKESRFETVEGTYLIRVSMKWDDPVAAAWFANALADAIVTRAQQMARKSGNRIAESLTARLAVKQAELDALNLQSRALKRTLGIVDIDRQKQSLLEARLLEQSQLTTDMATLKANQGQVAGLRRQSSGRLTSAQQILEQTLAVEGPKAGGLREGIRIRESRIASIGAQLARLGQSDELVKTLDARAAALQTEVTALTERASFSEIENVANGPQVQVIDRAAPPLTRSSPKILVNTALGFIAGCALSGCFLLVFGAAPVRQRETDVVDDGDAAVAAAEVKAAAASAAEAASAAAAADLAMERAAEVADAIAHEKWQELSATVNQLGAAHAEPVRQTAAAGGGEAVFVPSNRPAAAAPASAPGPALAPASTAKAVASEPDDGGVARRKIGDPHIFRRILPPPSATGEYSAEDHALFGPLIIAWLGDMAAPDGKPLLVAGSDGDIHAQALYRLIYQQLLEEGVIVRTFDVTSGAAMPKDGGRGTKPLVYGGGLKGSGDPRALARSDQTVMAVSVSSDAHAIDAVRAFSSQIDALMPNRAYVAAISA